MAVEIFFLGLDQIGTSIGMAMAQAEIQQEILRIGYDPDPRLAHRAQELEAVDRLVGHPRNAPKSADLVIIDTAVADVREYLGLLGKPSSQTALSSIPHTSKLPLWHGLQSCSLSNITILVRHQWLEPMC